MKFVTNYYDSLWIHIQIQGKFKVPVLIKFILGLINGQITENL